MKQMIFGFLIGFSFFVTRWLFDIATTDIANKPGAWLMYLAFPLLILLVAVTKDKGEM
jgi:hypothetical protein